MGFQSEVRLFCGDNLRILREQIPDDHVQLTVTSPPYDDLRTYNGFSWNFEGLARELYRVTKPGGVVVWVVADATVKGSETGTSFRQALYFKECGFNLHDTMIWDKASCANIGSPVRYWSTFEYMFVFSKGPVSVGNMIKDRKNKASGRSLRGSTTRESDGHTHKSSTTHMTIAEFGKRTNVWEIPPEMNRNIKHPAPFPESIANDHIFSWSNPGDIVLDPFLGSGTTEKMAVLNNRHFIGCEISEEYFRNAQFRITIAQAEQMVSR